MPAGVFDILFATSHRYNDNPDASPRPFDVARDGLVVAEGAGTANFLGQGVAQDRVEGYVWTSLAAAQDNERARSFVPVMEKELTEEQLESAQSRIDQFRSKEERSARGIPRHKLPRHNSSDASRSIAGARQRR